VSRVESPVSMCVIAFIILATQAFQSPFVSCQPIAVLSDVPTIELPFPPGAEVLLTTYWSLNPNMTYSMSFWVSDEDGVESVFLHFMPLSEGEWHNLSVEMTGGNNTRGFYEATFSWQKTGIDWDVFARDTNGNWGSNGTIRYLIDTIGIDPLIVLIPTMLVFVVVYAILVKRQHRL